MYNGGVSRDGWATTELGIGSLRQTLGILTAEDFSIVIDRADIDFVTCPTFLYVARTDHRLLRVSQRQANRASLAGYKKFNTSLQEIQDFWDRLESLVQRALVGAVTGNKCWGFLKHRIKDFAIKFCHLLNLDRTKVTKSLKDKFFRAVEGGESLAI